MFNPAAAQVTQKLSNVLVSQSLARFQLDGQFAINQQIGQIIAENCSIFV